jgi:hypothetical protein
MRNGSEFAEMPVSGRRRRLLIAPKTNWIDSGLRMQTSALRLYGCTKFDKLIRYRCANLFFLVLPEELFRDPEIPVGWGTLVESNGALTLARKPIWHETTQQDRIRLLHRIAVAGTRALNRNLHDPGVFLQPL